MVKGSKEYDMSKFQNFVKKKYNTCTSVHLNILCLDCINLNHTSNYAEFDRNAWIYPIFNLNMQLST